MPVPKRFLNLHPIDRVRDHVAFVCLYRYKVVELAFYLMMGFFPASVMTSMVIFTFMDLFTVPFSLFAYPESSLFQPIRLPQQVGGVMQVFYFLFLLKGVFRVFQGGPQQRDDSFNPLVLLINVVRSVLCLGLYKL